MASLHSDALVLFGVTGELAHKMIVCTSARRSFESNPEGKR
jgi:hypothetical protein